MSTRGYKQKIGDDSELDVIGILEEINKISEHLRVLNLRLSAGKFL